MPDPAPLIFGGTTVAHEGPYTITTLPGGARIVAAVENTDAYRVTALRLCYGSDTLRMMREHEAGHAWLAHVIGLPESPTLRNVADGLGDTALTGLEEDAVCCIQRFANAAGIRLSDVFARWADRRD